MLNNRVFTRSFSLRSLFTIVFVTALICALIGQGRLISDLKSKGKIKNVEASPLETQVSCMFGSNGFSTESMDVLTFELCSNVPFEIQLVSNHRVHRFEPFKSKTNGKTSFRVDVTVVAFVDSAGVFNVNTSFDGELFHFESRKFKRPIRENYETNMFVGNANDFDEQMDFFALMHHLEGNLNWSIVPSRLVKKRSK